MEAELSDDACRELLRSARVGRVAVATPAGPDVVPVDFRLLDLDGDPALVVRTTPYSVLDAARPGATVAFETESPTGGERTYVVVRGPVRPVTDAATLGAVRAAWGDTAGLRRSFLVVELAHVNGRRLGTGQS